MVRAFGRSIQLYQFSLKKKMISFGAPEIKKYQVRNNYALTTQQVRNIGYSVVALIMGKNGEKMDFGYGKTFLEKVSWGGPETPFCGISGPIPACGGVYTEKWTKF